MTPGDDNPCTAQAVCAGLPVDDDAIAASLCELIAAGNTTAVVATLGELARLRGMSQVARDTGLAREALYRALRADSHPRFDTIMRVCSALGIKLSAHTIEADC